MAIEYYYNLVTGEVELGRQSGATARMGPYPTRELASQALAIAAKRNSQWEKEDEKWDTGRYS